jgi:hypothetical protein
LAGKSYRCEITLEVKFTLKGTIFLAGKTLDEQPQKELTHKKNYPHKRNKNFPIPHQ